MLTAAQCRMGRAALKWTVRELAEKAGMSKDTITAFESGGDVKLSTMEKLRNVLEKAGVVFIAENGGGAGVRLRKPNKEPRK
jgi:transcriptional regulator with XRE-family HTH domain